MHDVVAHHIRCPLGLDRMGGRVRRERQPNEAINRMKRTSRTRSLWCSSTSHLIQRARRPDTRTCSPLTQVVSLLTSSDPVL
uniref:Uncharacterized protein n=1 Tax=Arundo donax TaxID=35708 RepID=A0A0A9U0G3_ARUDO